MDKSELNKIKKKLEIANASIRQLEKQRGRLNAVIEESIERTEGQERQKLRELKVLADRANTIAGKGGDFQSVLQQIQERFK